MLASVFRKGARSPGLLIYLVPFVLYLLAIQYARTHFYRDPTGPYFDPSRAYQRIYTNQRKAEALKFVEDHNTSAATPFKRESHVPPWMCVGMNTIARPSGDVYARASLASFIMGLSQKERNQVFFMPMIGHINATTHPIYNEPWLNNIADKVLTYQNSDLMTPDHLKHIEELELTRQKTGVPDREKHLGDYTHLLRECASTKAPYVLMLEDDVLAMDGWFHRMRRAIKEVEKRASSYPNKWFYIRLFHTEGGLGWRKEETRSYVISTIVAAALVLFIYGAGFYVMSRTTWGAPLTAKHGRTAFRLLIISFCLFTYFFFTVGRLSVLPEPIGVREMPGGGCCAQGIIYPNAKIEPLTAWYEKNRIGFVDTLAERLADEKPDGLEIGSRWAITPVLLQHFGGQSSKGDNWGSDKPGQMSEAQRLWNFQYETNDARKLAKEHEAAAKAFELERTLGAD